MGERITFVVYIYNVNILWITTGETKRIHNIATVFITLA